MKIINKQERKISFWKFSLMSLIPIFLAIVIGFVMGFTSSEEQINYKKAYEKVRIDLDRQKHDADVLAQFIHESDSLLEAIFSKAIEWDKDLKLAVEDDTQSDLWRSIKREYQKNAEKIDDMYTKIPSKNYFKATAEKVSDQFIAAIGRRRTSSQLTIQKAELSKGVVMNEDFEEKERTHDDEKDELEDQIRNLAFDLKVAKQDLTDCNEDKSELKQQLQSGSASTQQIQIDNAPHLSKIKKEIEIIQKDIIPGIQVKLLNTSKKDIRVIKEQLRSHLAIINESVNEIE